MKKTMKLKSDSDLNYRIAISEDGFIDIPYVDCTGSIDITYRDFTGIRKKVSVKSADFAYGNESLFVPSLDDISVDYNNCGGKNIFVVCPDAKFGSSTFCIVSKKAIIKRSINQSPELDLSILQKCGTVCTNAITSKKRIIEECASAVVAPGSECSSMLERCCCIYKNNDCCTKGTKTFDDDHCNTIRANNVPIIN